MDRYKIIAEDNVGDLEKIVNSHIKAGFLPHGSVAITSRRFIQPMVYSKPKAELHSGTAQFGIEVLQQQLDNLVRENAKNDDPYDNLIAMELLGQLIEFLKTQLPKKET